MATSQLDVRLKKVNKVYQDGDMVSGVVVVLSKGDLSHLGITLTMEGSVSLQVSAKSVGVFEAFYNSIKPITLVQYTAEVAKSGKIPSGKTEIPFELPLRAKANKKLYDTYHGVFVNIQYTLRCDMKRSMLNKDLTRTIEFIIESKSTEVEPVKTVEFCITPETLNVVKDKPTNIPRFKVTGSLNTTVCNINAPFSGNLVVEHAEQLIKSIELQLVRVETCGCAEGYAKDATEIQNIQIGEGDVCRGLTIPIHMVFPRLFTCPTLVTSNFKVEFEVNIVVVFQDDRIITENFPIKIIRS